MKHQTLIFLAVTNLLLGCFVKNKQSTTMDNNNPLICDPNEGICVVNDSSSSLNQDAKPKEKNIKVIYFTDPICSSCWGIEAQIRKLKLEYGNAIEIEYCMGGLLADWSYNSGGISKPSDVAGHWDEVSAYYDMPIDGDIWLQDPLESSYPPSIAFKAAQLQSQEKAILFLRTIREMVFIEKKNICKWSNLEEAALKVGLNKEQFKTDYEGKAKLLFEEDLKKTRSFNVRGFPTMYFIDKNNNKELVYGSKPYQAYESAILKLDATIKKSQYNQNWETLFLKYNTYSAKEYSELSGVPRNKSEDFLNNLVSQGKLEKLTCKNGSIWKLKP
mgnify:CR=1 FL=1